MLMENVNVKMAILMMLKINNVSNAQTFGIDFFIIFYLSAICSYNADNKMI